MNKARLFGPFLMILLGAALLVGPGGSPVNAAFGGPCDTGSGARGAVAVTLPCNPCPILVGGAVVCPTTTTTIVQTTAVQSTQPVVTFPVTIPPTTVPGTTIPVTTVPVTTVPETTVVDRTTIPDETTVVEPTTVPVETSTGKATTTVPSDVSGAGANSTPPRPNVAGANNSRPNVANAQLARTGSNDVPLTAAGISLIVLGAGLAILGRRNRLQDNT